MCSATDDMTHPKNRDHLDADAIEREILEWLLADSFTARQVCTCSAQLQPHEPRENVCPVAS